MKKKRMPKEVYEIIDLIATATGTRLFHNLKQANSKVSDQRLTDVVIYAMTYARSRGLEIR